MDLSKLSSNDKLAALGAVLAIGAGIPQLWWGWLIRRPDRHRNADHHLPAAVFAEHEAPWLEGEPDADRRRRGGDRALLALLGILSVLGAFGLYGGTWFIGLLLGVAGGLLMGWASWKEFQSEGGKFNVGMASTPPAPPAPPAQTYTPPPAPPAQSYTPPPAIRPPPPPPPPAGRWAASASFRTAAGSWRTALVRTAMESSTAVGGLAAGVPRRGQPARHRISGEAIVDGVQRFAEGAASPVVGLAAHEVTHQG